MKDFEPRKPILRWMIRRDMPEVLDIERRCFDFPWDENDDFIRCLRQRDVIGKVAEVERPPGDDAFGRVVGFVIYQICKNAICILNFAVHPEERRLGLGNAMISDLKSRLSFQRRSEIFLAIRETNVEAQKFFRAQGFQAKSISRDFYDDTPEDAYHFSYRIGQAVAQGT